MWPNLINLNYENGPFRRIAKFFVVRNHCLKCENFWKSSLLLSFSTRPPLGLLCMLINFVSFILWNCRRRFSCNSMHVSLMCSRCTSLNILISCVYVCFFLYKTLRKLHVQISYPQLLMYTNCHYVNAFLTKLPVNQQNFSLQFFSLN